MNVQVITRDGEAEYAVLRWADYQALLAAAGPTGAALVSQTGPFGPNTHTLDTETGLVWLDLTESTNYSHTQILAEIQPGGVFEGYHLATGAEVAELFANAGIPLLTTDFVPQNYASVVALMNLIGVLGTNVRARAFYERQGFTIAGRRQYRVGNALCDDFIYALDL